MVPIVQLAERLTVDQEVVGSTPTGHPYGLPVREALLFISPKLGIKPAQKLAIMNGKSGTPSHDGGFLYDFCNDLARECF